MSLKDRQEQFEAAVASSHGVIAGARFARNFGFSNSARVLEGGLFACTANMEGYSEKLVAGTAEPVQQFIFLCVLTFPPHDEVYFAITVSKEAGRVNTGLLKLYNDAEKRNAGRVAEGRPSGSINNNVKFYITTGGQLYFHNNDFKETLVPEPGAEPLDPDCMARVDSILFGIWPPSASAHSSLLARDFVGYLGSLVGRENVHELRIWDDANVMPSSMCRMPSTVDVPDIESEVAALGGHYPKGEVRRLHAALNFLEHKHFVILSGLSGTGKTQLALRYARAVHGLTEKDVDPLLFVCPVRPEWTDPTGLTGYYDVLSNRYIVPPFLEAVLAATAHRSSPVFVVLDELNLARVEYYLSDVLSCLETGTPLQLHSNGVPLEGSTGTSIRAELPLPSNLFIIGTINVDETTNPVSDKVLDRASVIDMSSVDVQGFLTSLQTRSSGLAPACGAVGPALISLHGLMQPHGLGFGYRVIEECVRYHAFDASHIKTPADEVTDQLLVQKVLIKLRGADRQRQLLTDINRQCDSYPAARAFVQRLLHDLDSFGSFQAMR